VLFIIRHVNTGNIVAKVKPNYPEFRWAHAVEQLTVIVTEKTITE